MAWKKGNPGCSCCVCEIQSNPLRSQDSIESQFTFDLAPTPPSTTPPWFTAVTSPVEGTLVNYPSQTATGIIPHPQSPYPPRLEIEFYAETSGAQGRLILGGSLVIQWTVTSACSTIEIIDPTDTTICGPYSLPALGLGQWHKIVAAYNPDDKSIRVWAKPSGESEATEIACTYATGGALGQYAGFGTGPDHAGNIYFRNYSYWRLWYCGADPWTEDCHISGDSWDYYNELPDRTYCDDGYSPYCAWAVGHFDDGDNIACEWTGDTPDWSQETVDENLYNGLTGEEPTVGTIYTAQSSSVLIHEATYNKDQLSHIAVALAGGGSPTLSQLYHRHMLRLRFQVNDDARSVLAIVGALDEDNYTAVKATVRVSGGVDCAEPVCVDLVIVDVTAGVETAISPTHRFVGGADWITDPNHNPWWWLAIDFNNGSVRAVVATEVSFLQWESPPTKLPYAHAYQGTTATIVGALAWQREIRNETTATYHGAHVGVAVSGATATKVSIADFQAGCFAWPEDCTMDQDCFAFPNFDTAGTTNEFVASVKCNWTLASGNWPTARWNGSTDLERGCGIEFETSGAITSQNQVWATNETSHIVDWYADLDTAFEGLLIGDVITFTLGGPYTLTLTVSSIGLGGPVFTAALATVTGLYATGTAGPFSHLRLCVSGGATADSWAISATIGTSTIYGTGTTTPTGTYGLGVNYAGGGDGFSVLRVETFRKGTINTWLESGYQLDCEGCYLPCPACAGNNFPSELLIEVAGADESGLTSTGMPTGCTVANPATVTVRDVALNGSYVVPYTATCAAGDEFDDGGCTGPATADCVTVEYTCELGTVYLDKCGGCFAALDIAVAIGSHTTAEGYPVNGPYLTVKLSLKFYSYDVVNPLLGNLGTYTGVFYKYLGTAADCTAWDQEPLTYLPIPEGSAAGWPFVTPPFAGATVAITSL